MANRKARLDPTLRKQVYDLTIEDLEACAMWEFALDEEDVEGRNEATVRPCAELTSYDPQTTDIGLAVIRTRFVDAEGGEYLGYCTPWSEDHLGSIQPVIVTPGGQVNFWFGLTRPSDAEVEQLFDVLGKPPYRVLPIRFEATVPAPNLFSSGTIAGVRGLG